MQRFGSTYQHAMQTHWHLFGMTRAPKSSPDPGKPAPTQPVGHSRGVAIADRGQARSSSIHHVSMDSETQSDKGSELVSTAFAAMKRRC
jgi:hypothetical protein